MAGSRSLKFDQFSLLIFTKNWFILSVHLAIQSRMPVKRVNESMREP